MHTALSTSALPKYSSAMNAPRDRLSVSNDRLTVTKPRSRPPGLRLRFAPSAARPAFPFDVQPGILGNHLAIQGFLQKTLHGPTPAEFAAATSRPDYLPSERFLVRRPDDRALVAHIQVQPQRMQFGRVQLPVARIRDFVVLPEFEAQGLGRKMVSHAEAVAQEAGAMLILARGEDGAGLSQQGWSPLGCDPVSNVSPQRILGQLPQPAEPESPFYRDQMPVPELRLARLTDLAALQALYERYAGQAYGTLVRSTDYWSWLLTKNAHDRMFMYLEDAQPLGYVVIRGSSIVEIVDVSNDGRASARLIERAAADAIEQGRHTLRIHAPFGEWSHRWSDLAGGKTVISGRDEAWMVKILSLRNVMRRLAPELHRRVRAHGGKQSQDIPAGFGIRVGSDEFLITPGVRSMRITRGRGKHQIALTSRAASQLVLGYRSVDELAGDRVLSGATSRAIAAARLLFPPLPLWRNQWDEAPSLRI